MSAIVPVSKSGYSPVMKNGNSARKTRAGGRRAATRSTPRPRRAREYPNRIRELASHKKLTYAQIAEATGTHEITIARLATGNQQLTHDWMKRLGAAMGVKPEEIISRPGYSNLRAVRVTAALGESWAASHDFEASEQYEVMIPDEDDLRELALYAVELASEAMNRRYPVGAVIVLSRLRQTPDEIATGRRYHVRFTRTDGQQLEGIRLLEADDSGRHWLRPESSDPHFQQWQPLEGADGIKVELIGRVRFAVHREN